MKAQIEIEKTFDETRGFTKEYEQGDFKEFFNDEGEYMDRLADTLKKSRKSRKFISNYLHGNFNKVTAA